jgi:hypothetical protein
VLLAAVSVSKQDRKSVVRDNADRGQAHATNWIRSFSRSRDAADNIAIFPSMNKSMLAKHVNPNEKLDDDDQE